MPMEEPRITVGICDRYPEIRGRMNGLYRTNGTSLTGGFTARPEGGAVVLCDDFGREILRAPEIRLAAAREATFTLQRGDDRRPVPLGAEGGADLPRRPDSPGGGGGEADRRQ